MVSTKVQVATIAGVGSSGESRGGDISDVNYTVETVNGIVYLMGIARSRPELDKVTTHARNIAGVQKVISHVRLSGDDRRGKS